jgi:hypothetical protein
MQDHWQTNSLHRHDSCSRSPSIFTFRIDAHLSIDFSVIHGAIGIEAFAELG